MDAIKPQVLVCAKCPTKGKGLTLGERQAHFAKCSHPECVRKMAFYEQVAKYVEDNLQNKVRK